MRFLCYFFTIFFTEYSNSKRRHLAAIYGKIETKIDLSLFRKKCCSWALVCHRFLPIGIHWQNVFQLQSSFTYPISAQLLQWQTWRLVTGQRYSDKSLQVGPRFQKVPERKTSTLDSLQTFTISSKYLNEILISLENFVKLHHSLAK